MVVAVTNQLEMSNLESKAYTVINKVNTKDTIKDKAALVIGKASKIYLQIKKDERIPVAKLYELNKSVIDFKNTRR